MKKDVIYIDIEDDITAIIEKVKAASAKIVALVPPKRTGVLQSAVNLKLLQKSALEDTKHIVLITSDNSLTSLAAGVKIPVAKNLQSKPEIPAIPALQVDDNDVINGEELPVGDIAQAAGTPAKQPDSAADAISDEVDFADKAPAAAATKSAAKKGSLGSKIKVPNFNKFRKKFFIIGSAAVLLVAFLIWALLIAPTATITINAKTKAVNVDRTLTLKPGIAASQISELQIKPNLQQLKKSAVEEFTATGTKDVGEKATGQISISNSDNSDSVTVPAGTVFTASGKQFTSNTGVTVPGAKVVAGKISPGTATVAVVATDIGPEFNLAAQAYAITGFSSLGASGTQMAGGTRDKVTVVSQDDVDKAKDRLSKADLNAVKTELRKQFKGDYIIIEESFVTQPGTPAVSPGIGEQAQKAKVTLETTYIMLGVARTEAKQLLSDVLKDALDDEPNQSVFSDGSNTIKFQEFQKLADDAYSVRLITTGYIGTTIDIKDLANKVKGKRYGEIEQIVNQIPGVNKVDIKFSPFWVTGAPNNSDKITIKFTVVNDTN